MSTWKFAGQSWRFEHSSSCKNEPFLRNKDHTVNSPYRNNNSLRRELYVTSTVHSVRTGCYSVWYVHRAAECFDDFSVFQSDEICWVTHTIHLATLCAAKFWGCFHWSSHPGPILINQLISVDRVDAVCNVSDLFGQGSCFETPSGYWPSRLYLAWLFSVSPGKYRCLKLGCISYFSTISKSFIVFIPRIFLRFHFLTNKMNKLKYNKTDHKTHFILGTKCYMFWQQDAILREFIRSWYLVWSEC